MKIVEASFVTSAPNIKLAPQNEYINEVVFLARSNVGKSSILNALTSKKSLAKVSSSPGKTRLINFFDVRFKDRDTLNELNAVLVDLPGFGYARVSKSIKKDWEKNLTSFIASRKQVKVFVHLIDSRHPELEIDHSVDEYINEIIQPYQVVVKVFTKIDKLNQKEKSALRKKYPDTLFVSNTKKTGIFDLSKLIYELILDDNV